MCLCVRLFRILPRVGAICSRSKRTAGTSLLLEGEACEVSVLVKLSALSGGERKPPSDEGGGFLRSKKTEGEKLTRTFCTVVILSLHQSRYRSTAPSTEGASRVGAKTKIHM